MRFHYKVVSVNALEEITAGYLLMTQQP